MELAGCAEARAGIGAGGRELSAGPIWHDSRTLFTRVLDVDPRSDAAYTNLAADAIDYGHPAEAERYARQAVQLNPDWATNGITLGVALQRQGRYAEAAKEFLKVAQAHPDNVVALTNLAIELQRSGHLDQAIAICRGLIQMDSQSSDAHRASGFFAS